MSFITILSLPTSAFSFYFIITLFQNMATWGQVRYMGMTFPMYKLLSRIYLFVFLHNAFGIVENFTLNISLFQSILIDTILFAIMIALIAVLYYQISQREKFKPEIFAKTIMRPLGLPEELSRRVSVFVVPLLDSFISIISIMFRVLKWSV